MHLKRSIRFQLFKFTEIFAKYSKNDFFLSQFKKFMLILHFLNKSQNCIFLQNL